MAMTEILLDTNAYVAFKRGNPDAVAIFQQATAINLPTVVLGELLGGFLLGNQRERNQRELNRFLASPRVTIIAVTAETAAYYATIYQQLRQMGNPIPTNDMWIAALALQNRLPIFTYDQHFLRILHLKIISTPDDV